MAKASLPKTQRTSDPYKWAGKSGVGTGPVPIQRWTMSTSPTTPKADTAPTGRTGKKSIGKGSSK